MQHRSLLMTLCVHVYVVTSLLGPMELVLGQVVEMSSEGDAEAAARKNLLEYQRYVKLFEHQRAIQIDAVKSLQKSSMKYDRKYKLIETMLRDLFNVLEQAKNNLTSAGFVPGDPFPEKQPLRDAMSKVFENTAMFGDLILRLPDLTHDIYSKNKNWEFLIGWGVWFSMESGIFKGPHEKLLTLMSMEIGLQEKDETYVNPYKHSDDILLDTKDFEKELEDRKKKEKSEKIKKKSEETKKKRKGPKLSGGGHTEL